MFMNTMAVGPFEPAVLCVAGGATVAMDDRCSHGRALWQIEALENGRADDLQGSFVMDLRVAIRRSCTREGE